MLSFIDHDYVRQIRILYFIINADKPVSIDEISKHIGSSTNTILAILPVINDNLLTIDFELKKTKQKKYYLKSNINNQSISLDSYILYCGKRSLVFSIVEELFSKGKINTTEFCYEKYISQATFSRGKTKLNDLLKRSELELPTHLTEGIIGSEYKIRIFYFNFFYSFYNTLEWPFEENIIEKSTIFFDPKLKEIFNSLSMIKKKKFYYLIYIIKKRTLQGKYIHEENLNFVDLDNYNSYYNFLGEYISNHQNKKESQKKRETNFFIFSLYALDIIDIDLSVNFSKNELDMDINNLWIDKFKAKFKQDITNDENVFFKKNLNLLSNVYRYIYFPGDTFSKNELFGNQFENYDSKLLEQTKTFFFYLMENQNYRDYKETQLAHISQSSIIKDYYQYIYLFFCSMKKRKKILIFISDSIDKISKNILEKQLELVFGDNILIKKKVNSEIELILTTEENEGHGIEKFVIYSYQDDRTFFKIAQRIQEMIYNQL